MERRKFLSWVGVGGIATYLPVAIVACSPQANNNTSEPKPPELDQTSRADGFIAIATIAQLEEQGQIVKKVNDVIVFRDPNTSELVALKSLCTHEGCTVDWKANDKNLACPCHGSAFGIDGAVIEGPAKKPLDVYETKEENGIVLVKLA